MGHLGPTLADTDRNRNLAPCTRHAPTRRLHSGWSRGRALAPSARSRHHRHHPMSSVGTEEVDSIAIKIRLVSVDGRIYRQVCVRVRAEREWYLGDVGQLEAQPRLELCTSALQAIPLYHRGTIGTELQRRESQCNRAEEIVSCCHLVCFLVKDLYFELLGDVLDVAVHTPRYIRDATIDCWRAPETETEREREREIAWGTYKRNSSFHTGAKVACLTLVVNFCFPNPSWQKGLAVSASVSESRIQRMTTVRTQDTQRLGREYCMTHLFLQLVRVLAHVVLRRSTRNQ